MLMRDKEHTDMKVLIGIEKKSVKKEIIMLKPNLVLDFYSIYLMYETRSSQLVLDAMEYKGKGTMYCLLTV